MNLFKQKKRIISMFLVLVLLLTVIPPIPASAATSHEDFIRVFHLDVGRKYFTVEQVTEIIDALAANGYTHIELAIGNNGLRFLLDDMSITVGSTTYTSDKVKAGVKQGNINYAHAGEWSEAEMDQIIAYADAKNIGIIPLVNTPGHMNVILEAAKYVGISNPAYGAKVSSGWWGSTSTKYSTTTVSLSNAAAVGFTQALLQKYVDYFSAKGCEYFNLGADEYAADVHSSGSMGFGVMQSGGWYDDYVNYINEVCAIIKAGGMKPIAFNDGVYFNENDDTTFDRDLIIAYWIPEWGTYYVASPAYLVSKGHKILNTNDDWYYVIGRTSEGYGYDNAYNGVNKTPVTKVADGSTMALSNLTGSMNCVWCDEPNASYDSNKSNVMYFIETLAAKNPTYFVVNTHEHTFETVTVAATCTENGSVTTTCTGCGESSMEVLPATGHDYDCIVTDAACDANGSRVYTCGSCGDTYTEIIPAFGHNYSAVVTDATCTEAGFTTYTCATCGDSYVADEVAALGHSYTSVVTAPTCTEAGYTTYTCANCGHSYVADEVAALGHSYTSVVTAPTCTENGFSTYTCTCGHSYVADEVAALGHDYTSVVTAPTCTENGFTTYTCTTCGHSYVADEVAALGHTCTSVVTAPTCTEAGYTTHTCTTCGNVTVDAQTAALGHAYETITVEATCTADGSITRNCARCGDHSVEIIPAAGHSYDAVTQQPTCENDGFVNTVCNVCGDAVEEILPALGHNYAAVVTAPTCTEGGYTTFTCTTCGHSYVADEVAALGHTYTSVVTAPTCTEGGYTTYTCTCGHSYVADEVAALGHTYDSVVTAPTCTEGGYTTYTCTCGHSYVADEVAALGHAYTSVVTAPTCTSGGYTTHTCGNCGDSYIDAQTQVTEHTYSMVETDGNQIYTCTGCGDSYSVSIGWTALTGRYVLDTNGIDIGAGHKYIVVGSNSNYAMTLSGSTIGAAAVTVSNNTISLADGSAYEFYFVDNGRAENGSYLLTRDGTNGVYHMGGDMYYGRDNKGYWHIGSSSNGAYQIYDYDNSTWYLNYGYVWANQSVNRFAVSSNQRTVRLFKATEDYARLYGELNQTWTHGSGATVEAILAKIQLQTSTDGANVTGNAQLDASMLSWDQSFDGYTAGTYTASVIYRGVQIGTITVTVTGEHTYATETVAPTCTEQGYTTYTCTVCGLSHTDDHTAALGHSYSTTEGNGTITYTCDRCGHSYTESTISYQQVSSIASGSNYVITLYSGGNYYALSHKNNTISAVQIQVSNGQIVSEVTDDLIWNYSGSKLSYRSGNTTYYLYAGSNNWWGNWWGSTPTLSISTGNSTNVSFSSNKLKVGSNYLRYSNGSISLNRSATTSYVFLENAR